MASPKQRDKKIGFKTIVLLKDQTLGVGAYGSVCQAKCDDLLCAAKIIHPTLFDPTALHQIAPHEQHRLPIRRFQLECEFLSTVRHPNIVQYLGTHQDPETRLPVLLMELMDDSLTHFLESSPQPIPYHIQVNICHDISLALSFLHSNSIIHRDLSSNNVLMRGDILAKVTDFGMARLGDINPQATHVSNTMCPGTDVYMPPEAVQDKPVYTEKIDCFSFGVIAVQALTREFPRPGDRLITINDRRYPRPIKMSVPEIERRQNHISRIDPNHPLLPIALDCLKDADGERPSAQQLCERLAALKETAKYKNASERVKDRRGKEEEYEKKLEAKDHVISQKDAVIAEKEQQLRQSSEEIQQQSLQIQQLEREKKQIAHQLEREGDQAVQEQKRNMVDSGQYSSVSSLNLRWREGGTAPYKMERYYDAILYNGMAVYCMYGRSSRLCMYTYHVPSSVWSAISDCPQMGGYTVAVVDGLLTTVGGRGHDNKTTNKLLSLTEEGTAKRKWIEKFPPMPTKRNGVAALSTGPVLIVAGGYTDNDQRVNIVEVLNTETLQWQIGPHLPQPLGQPSLTLCGDRVYVLGGYGKGAQSVYFCSVINLLLSTGSKSQGRLATRSSKNRWKRVADLPVELSSHVTFNSQLLTLGGYDSKHQPTTAIHMYQPTTNSWEIISHMITPRSQCLSAVLPDNQLMVVGGYTTASKGCDSIEFGSVI